MHVKMRLLYLSKLKKLLYLSIQHMGGKRLRFEYQPRTGGYCGFGFGSVPNLDLELKLQLLPAWGQDWSCHHHLAGAVAWPGQSCHHHHYLATARAASAFAAACPRLRLEQNLSPPPGPGGGACLIQVIFSNTYSTSELEYFPYYPT